MRTWARAYLPKRCGGCGYILQRGDPVQILTRPPSSWRLTRCVDCAVGKPPLDLPPLPARLEVGRTTKARFRCFAQAGPTLADFKSQAAGDDDAA